MVVITPSGTPTAGQTYSLNCSLTGTTDPATYQWFHGNGTRLADVSQLGFSSLSVSEAGAYTCRATVGSVMVEDTANVEINCKLIYCCRITCIALNLGLSFLTVHVCIVFVCEKEG